MCIAGLEDVTHSNDEIRILIVPALIADTLTGLCQEAQGCRASLHAMHF